MAVSGNLVAKVVPWFQWEIDIKKLSKKSVGYCLVSPEFHSDHSDNVRENWQLKLYPKGFSAENQDYLALYLERLDDAASADVTVKLCFSLLNQNNDQVNSSYVKVRFESDQSGWGCEKFVKESFVLDPKNKVLKNNNLVILCKIVIDDGTQIETEKEIELRKSTVRLKEFDTFERLFTNSEFSDVTITAGGKNFKLHKCILSTRSPVLEAMFRSDMKEKKLNAVVIDDVRHEILQEVFRFIYTGKVVYTKDMLSELLFAAEKYCIEGLKSWCEQKMFDELGEDNAIEYLNSAIMNNAKKIKKEAIECIYSMLEVFICKEEFMAFGKQHPEVLIEIMNKNMAVSKTYFQVISSEEVSNY